VSPAAHDGDGTAVVLVGRPAVVTSIRGGRARRHSNVKRCAKRTCIHACHQLRSGQAADRQPFHLKPAAHEISLERRQRHIGSG